MRRWGILVTAFYALIVIVLLVPAFVFLAGDDSFLSQAHWNDVKQVLSYWPSWVLIAILVFGQALLLFTPVDTKQKRLTPRASVARTSAVVAILFAVLTFSVVLSIGVAANSDSFTGRYFDVANWVVAVGWIALFWAVWGVIFYKYGPGTSSLTAGAVSWLLKGSILELLIVVPCHIIVRRRNDCSAPIATSFGITTGIAVMLLSFGPSVLILYKKRLDSYPNRRTGSGSISVSDPH
jgi:hypothetical protein